MIDKQLIADALSKEQGGRVMQEKLNEIEEKYNTLHLTQLLNFDQGQRDAYSQGLKNAKNQILEIIEVHEENQLEEMSDERFNEFLKEKMDWR